MTEHSLSVFIITTQSGRWFDPDPPKRLIFFCPGREKRIWKGMHTLRIGQKTPDPPLIIIDTAPIDFRRHLFYYLIE